jgi:hypothetical protein
MANSIAEASSGYRYIVNEHSNSHFVSMRGNSARTVMQPQTKHPNDTVGGIFDASDIGNKVLVDFTLLKRITALFNFSTKVDALQISDEAKKVAYGLVASVFFFAECPNLRLSREGEVGLYWFNNLNRVRAVLDQADMRLYWIGEFQGQIVSGSDLPWSHEAPGALKEMLTRLYSNV